MEKGKLNIYGKVFKTLPGGTMIIPMLICALLNTVFPGLNGSLGGMSHKLFTDGTLAFAGLMLFSVGTTMDLKSIGTVLRRGIPLFAVKMAISFGASILFVKLFGLEGILGINAVAFTIAMAACNCGIFSNLMADFGDPADVALYPIVNIAALPFWPILILASAGSAGAFPWKDIVSCLLPLILGIVLGNLDPGLKNVFKSTMPIIQPFMGCCFGFKLNFISAISAGLSGVVLSVLYIVINGGLMFLGDRLLNKRPGYNGIAWASLTGIALAAPAMLGDAYAQYVPAAVAQLTMVYVVTSISNAYITGFVAKKFGCPKYEKEIGAKAQ